MSQKAPKTKIAELTNEISLYSLLNPPSEFEIQKLFREAEKLKKINPSQGFMITALIYCLKNDYENTVSAFKNSIANVPEDRETVILNYSLALINLGEIKEGYDILINNYLEGSYNITAEICRTGLALGLFEQITKYIEKLSTFSNSSKDVNNLNSKATIFRDSNITEQETSDVYNLLISIYTSYKVRASYSSIINDHENNSLITALYFDEVSSETLTNLNLDLIQKLTESELPVVAENRISPVFLKASMN